MLRVKPCTFELSNIIFPGMGNVLVTYIKNVMGVNVVDLKNKNLVMLRSKLFHCLEVAKLLFMRLL